MTATRNASIASSSLGNDFHYFYQPNKPARYFDVARLTIHINAAHIETLCTHFFVNFIATSQLELYN
jgi:hypothetical protein